MRDIGPRRRVRSTVKPAAPGLPEKAPRRRIATTARASGVGAVVSSASKVPVAFTVRVPDQRSRVHVGEVEHIFQPVEVTSYPH